MHKVLIALLLAPFVASVPGVAWDVAGRWWGEAVIDGNSQPVYITLIRDGKTLKGSGGPSPTEQSVLANGKIEGGKIAFDVLPGGRTPLHFELAEDGEWLKGTVKAQRNGQTVTGTVALRRRSN